MTRKKKIRSGGPIGVAKSIDQTSGTGATTKKPQKHKHKGKGKPAGNKQQDAVQNANKQRAQNKKSQDPRLGSKRPVPLHLPTREAASKPKDETPARVTPATPEQWQQELEQLEQDKAFMTALEALEQGAILPQHQQQQLEAKLERYEFLLDKLGLDEDDEDDLDALSKAGDDLKKDWW